jgi:hypothetical protein
MWKTGWLAIAAMALVVLVTACGAGAAASPSQTLDAAQAALAPPGPTLGALRSGDLLAWLASRPARPVKGVAELDVYLVGADGRPVTGARVVLDSDMTNMSHGPNLVEASARGDGHYSGRVRFLMPGPWRIIAVVDLPGRETVKLRFPINVTF